MHLLAFLRSRALVAGIGGTLLFSVCSGTAGATPVAQGLTQPVSSSVAGSYASNIDSLGTTEFPTVYAGDQMNPNGSVTVYVGPGSDTAFVSRVKALPLAGVDDAPAGMPPAVSFVSVPHNVSTLNAARDALTHSQASLASKGYALATWSADAASGTIQAQLSAAPAGMTADGATAQLDTAVAPEIHVVSVTAPPATKDLNRQGDASPWKGSDRIYGQTFGNSCTAGFSVMYYGFVQMLTAAHCQDQGFINSPGLVLGSTSSYILNDGAGQDIQTLNPPSAESYTGNVWVGTGTNQPTEMPVGGPFANRPANGQPLTFDGSYSKTVRFVNLENNNACTHFTQDPPGVNFCGLLQFNYYNGNGQPSDQEGDSGGPVFCYACYPRVVTPAGIIEGQQGTTYSYATWIGQDLSLTGTQILGG